MIRKYKTSRPIHIRETNKGLIIKQKIDEQLIESRKYLILSSYDNIKSMNYIDIKKFSKKSNVLSNIDDELISDLTIKSYSHKVMNTKNVVSIESNNHLNMVLESKNPFPNRNKYFEYIDHIRNVMTEPMANNDRFFNMKLISIHDKLNKVIRYDNIDAAYEDIKKKIDNNEYNEANDKIEEFV